METTDERTIKDFGDQWKLHSSNEGYYGSIKLLEDILASVASASELENARVADIGSGSGRIVLMLLAAGASEVYAVEPSDAYKVLLENTKAERDRIHYLNVRGEQLPPGLDLDFVISFGVLHHIVDPKPVVEAAYKSLRPGGEVIFWLYGYEGNELYVTLVAILRALTKRMPDPLLSALCVVLDYMLDLYIGALKVVPLPMKEYFCGHYQKLSRSKRRLTLFDQLNPAYAKYYREHEVRELVAQAGFQSIRLDHRHGYSWTVRAEKPQ